MKFRRPTLSDLLRTSAPREFVLLRLALAADLLLDGARLMRLHRHIGRGRLGEVVDLSRGALWGVGAVEIAAAGLLAAGLFVRPAAGLALGLAAVVGSAEFARIGGFSTASAFTGLAHAVVVGLVAACLVIRGGGTWSLDARLVRRARR